mmetsp:Transcript_5484/g.11567  ORF Transcript_5484/g.11567 Transcript_5484/m.11567 type:complete len:81 (-) Transcript_5484:80-322(-)
MDYICLIDWVDAQVMNVLNVAVVVTRWFGGIHLGPDRFKHISNAARDVLELVRHAHPVIILSTTPPTFFLSQAQAPPPSS